MKGEFKIQDRFNHRIPVDTDFREEVGEFRIDFFGRRYHKEDRTPWQLMMGRNRLINLEKFAGSRGHNTPAPHPTAVCDACGFDEKWDKSYLPQQFNMTVKATRAPKFRKANAFYDLRNGKTICNKCNLTTGSQFELDPNEWYADMGEHVGPENFRKEKRKGKQWKWK